MFDSVSKYCAEQSVIQKMRWWQHWISDGGRKKRIYTGKNSNSEEIEVDGNDSSSFKQKYMHKTSEAEEHIKYRR